MSLSAESLHPRDTLSYKGFWEDAQSTVLIMDQAVGTHSYRREYMYTVQWVESVYTACKVIKIGHNVHLTSCSKLG